MIKKMMFTILLAGLFSTLVQAQTNGSGDSYQTAIGLKFFPGAVSVKHFIKDNAAIEGLGYFWDRGFRITGLYQFHGDINGVDGLKWYAGGGAHIGLYSSKWGGGSALGIDGVVGLDYKLPGVPLNLSLDWQPSIEFGNKYEGFASGWGGLGIRYVLR
jgi:hypothetical protein